MWHYSEYFWEGGEQAKQRHSAKQALSIQLDKRYSAILVNMREKMVSSACNKVFEAQTAICQWYFSLFSFRKESEPIFFNLLRNYSGYLQHWIFKKKDCAAAKGIIWPNRGFCLCFTALAYFIRGKKTSAGALWRLLQVSLLAISIFSANKTPWYRIINYIHFRSYETQATQGWFFLKSHFLHYIFLLLFAFSFEPQFI